MWSPFAFPNLAPPPPTAGATWKRSLLEGLVSKNPGDSRGNQTQLLRTAPNCRGRWAQSTSANVIRVSSKGHIPTQQEKNRWQLKQLALGRCL